jgi:multiple antibiotic resistance protein
LADSSLRELLSIFLVALPAVFFVVDPFGVVPIFVAITARESPQKARETAKRACLVGCGVLLFFALFGGLVFKVLGVSLSAFRVAGGILLLVTSLDMLRGRTSQTKTSPEEEREGAQKDDVAVVPLAIPLLSGPGAIATVMVLVSKGRGLITVLPVLVSILLTFIASYYLLRGASVVQRVLGQSGVAILQRLMGLILAAIAVQFIADGARDLLQF